MNGFGVALRVTFVVAARFGKGSRVVRRCWWWWEGSKLMKTPFDRHKIL